MKLGKLYRRNNDIVSNLQKDAFTVYISKVKNYGQCLKDNYFVIYALGKNAVWYNNFIHLVTAYKLYRTHILFLPFFYFSYFEKRHQCLVFYVFD